MIWVFEDEGEPDFYDVFDLPFGIARGTGPLSRERGPVIRPSLPERHYSERPTKC
jgi:hypothetical protein